MPHTACVAVSLLLLAETLRRCPATALCRVGPDSPESGLSTAIGGPQAAPAPLFFRMVGSQQAQWGHCLHDDEAASAPWQGPACLVCFRSSCQTPKPSTRPIPLSLRLTSFSQWKMKLPFVGGVALPLSPYSSSPTSFIYSAHNKEDTHIH